MSDLQWAAAKLAALLLKLERLIALRVLL